MTMHVARYQKRVLLLLSAFIFLLPPPATGKTQAPLSGAMKSLLHQANTQYLTLFETTVDELANENPRMLASILGVTLQRQTNYAVDNPRYGNQYWQLRAECQQLLAFIAEQKEYKDPKNGGNMTVEDLEEEFFEGISGAPNDFFIKRFNIDPARVSLPMVLPQVVLSQQGAAMAPPGTITLGGETAPGAETSVEGGRVGLPPKVEQPPRDAVGDFPGKQAYKVEGRICPVQHPGGWNPEQTIDTNNNPNDGTKVSCFYTIRQGDQRLLSSQASYVNGKKQGVSLTYKKNSNGTIYLERIFEFNQGEQWQGAVFSENGQQKYSLRRNGNSKISTQFHPNGNKKSVRVEKGGESMSEDYYPNGQVSIRYVNGSPVGTWCPDGRSPGINCN